MTKNSLIVKNFAIFLGFSLKDKLTNSMTQIRSPSAPSTVLLYLAPYSLLPLTPPHFVFINVSRNSQVVILTLYNSL